MTRKASLQRLRPLSCVLLFATHCRMEHTFFSPYMRNLVRHSTCDVILPWELLILTQHILYHTRNRTKVHTSCPLTVTRIAYPSLITKLVWYRTKDRLDDRPTYVDRKKLHSWNLYEIVW
jgi:hypothetical protein